MTQIRVLCNSVHGCDFYRSDRDQKHHDRGSRKLERGPHTHPATLRPRTLPEGGATGCGGAGRACSYLPRTSRTRSAAFFAPSFFIMLAR
jgi:hypothetical protein